MTDSPGGDGRDDTPAAPARRTCYRHSDRFAAVRCQRCDQAICPDCMTPAAVGFQCPGCLHAGQAAIRQRRTSFGGVLSSDTRATSLGLILVNALVWLAVGVSDGLRSPVVDLLGLSARGICSDGITGYPNLPKAACDTPGDAFTWLPGFVDGAYWQPLTSLFTHVDLLHVGFNMVALFFLAPQLEHLLGRARLLAVYLLSGLAGSLLVVWVGSPYAPTIGASGCVFGLLGALLVVAVRRRLPLQGLLFWLGLNVVITVTGRDIISWEAHLGGFIGGVAAMLILAYAPREQRSRVQGAGLTVLGALIAVGLLARVIVG